MTRVGKNGIGWMAIRRNIYTSVVGGIVGLGCGEEGCVLGRWVEMWGGGLCCGEVDGSLILLSIQIVWVKHLVLPTSTIWLCIRADRICT